MKKEAIVLLVLTLLVLFTAVPTMAAPSNGQKVAITLKFTPVVGTQIPGDSWVTNGNVTHRRDSGLTYRVELSIDGAPPIIGTSVAERDPVMGILSKIGMAVYHETQVMSFPTEGGGFEGNNYLRFTDSVSPTVYTLQAHGVFFGTGAFEGQTINAWRYEGPSIPPSHWEGYLLKP